MDVVSSDVDVRQPELKRRRRVYGVRHFPPGCGPRATRRNVAVSDVVGGVSTLGLLENGADLVGADEANEVPVLVHLDSSLDDSVVSSDDAADVVESRDLTMSLELDDEIENDVGLRVSKIGSCDLTLSESSGQMDVDEKTDDLESNGDIQTVSPDYTNGLTSESPDSAGSSLFENLESGSEPARLLQDNAIGLSQDSSDADVHAPPKIVSMFKYPPRRKVLGVRVFPPNCGRNAKPLNNQEEEEEEEEEENIGALREMVETDVGKVEDVNVNAGSQEGQFESNVLDTKVKESIEKATRSPAEAISCSGDLVMADQECDELGKRSKVLHNSNRQEDSEGHLHEGQLESNILEQNSVTADTNVKEFIEKASMSPDEVASCSVDVATPDERQTKVVHKPNRRGDPKGCLQEDSSVRKAKVAAQREITKLSISKKITKQGLKVATNVSHKSNKSKKKSTGGLKVTKLSILKKITKQEPGGLKVATNASHKRNKRKKNSTSMARDKSSRPNSSLSENTNESMKEVSVNLTPFGPGSSKGFASDRKKVRETLRLFHFICRKLVHEAEARSNKGKTQIGRVDTIAAKELRNRGMCLNQGQYIVGAVPGVDVGDEFQFRLELNVIGLHRPTQAGIDFVKEGQDFIAVSIVASAGYNNNLDDSDVLDYTGQGDQKLENGNLGLKNSITTQNPVRVIRGYRKKPDSADVRSKVYVYDGLYNVEKYWHEPGQDGKLVLKFRMVRIPGQPELAWKQVKKSKKLKLREGLSDISQGKELIPISAVNTVDDENLPPFKYITQIMYPDTLTPPDGCSCRNRCSESGSCSCVAKNGGEIPFNNNGAIVEAKDLVYECGPSCKCPPSCYNRVSQKGISIQLEVFKTGSRGWGVRSMDSISSGSFICEYVGELVDDSEAERRTNDEYLFDLGGSTDDDDVKATMPSFTIDAAEYGNVGRFINHSCSPNLYAQNVLYDHGDQRIPHIMFFAAENIPPLQELSYHYNYQIDQVHDSQGNIKMKFCYCGSSECTGRMY
ncbi:Histone-lysine N-methyltransferase, H3 lysine-9 specific SUVH5 [Linum grandiflorum]